MAVRGQSAAWRPPSGGLDPARPRRGADARDPRGTFRQLRLIHPAAGVILYRCFAWNERARDRDTDGPLWFPRAFQGDGRHDNPDVYGCLYLAEQAVSAVVEQLARFRGSVLVPQILVRRGLPLALASLELDAAVELIDLDDP